MNKSFFYKISLLSIFFVAVLSSEQVCSDSSIVRQVMEQNLVAFPYEGGQWSCNTHYEYLLHTMNDQENLQQHSQRGVVFLMLDRYMQKYKIKQEVVLNDAVTWQDLNLFCGQTDLQYYVADKVDRTYTMLGRALLYNALAQPGTDIDKLRQKQAIIQELVHNAELFEQLETELLQVQQAEKMLLALWDRDAFKESTKQSYFKYSCSQVSDYLNKSEVVMNVSSYLEHGKRCSATVAAVVATAILPIYALSKLSDCEDISTLLSKQADYLRSSGGAVFGLIPDYDNKYVIASIMMGSSMFSGMSISHISDWTFTGFATDRFLHYKMCKVASVIRALKNIRAIVNEHEVLQTCFIDTHLNDLFSLQASDDTELLLNNLLSDFFASKLSLLNNKGKLLVTFKLCSDHKEELEDALIALGTLDMFVGLAKLYKQHVQSPAAYCFVDFVDSDKPMLQVDQFWNPLISPDKVVCNSVNLGCLDSRQDMIITGPNAGGKSTIIKAIATSIIMAQSFGIAPAASMQLTPFDKLLTYLNIVDDTGAGKSLFQAQVIRMQKVFDTVTQMSSGGKACIFADEMFNGTSPQEAQVCAYSVAKELGQYRNCMNIVATHYELLTTLSDKSDAYTNYHVSVQKSDNGELVYPFILSPGISNQHIAFDVLRNEGFSSSVVEQAQELLSISN